MNQNSEAKVFSISLIPKKNEPVFVQTRGLNPQDLKLEHDIQKQLNEFCLSCPDKDAPFNIVSAYFPMVSMWLGSGFGRVLRVTLESDGRFLDATNAAEADRLIGPGKTLGTLTAAFGSSESFL